MYKFIAIISILVRQFAIPNPFEALDSLPTVTIGGVEIILPPIFLNAIAGVVLVPITFTVVGLFYERGLAPAWGSFLFLLFYCVHTALLYLMSIAGFVTWVVVLIIVVYVALLIGVPVLCNRLSRRYF
ncbi:MAG: hypothetical protein ABFD18_06600 [Syntrophomonas sp.]